MKMNAMRPLALSIGLMFAYTGCASEGSSGLRFEQGIPEVAGADVREKILNNAGVNIIFLDSGTDVIPADSNLSSTYQALKDESPELLEEVSSNLTTATKGLYIPVSVDIVTAPLFDSSCIDATSEEELTAIHDNAGPLLEEDALNIIVADTLFCGKSANTPGKTTPGMPPLLTVAASYNFPDILTHELGHSAGLGHAGELLCDQPEAFQSCEKFPTIDYLSIMGYRDGKNFSNFELASIGLIDDDAILHNPSPGEIVLRDIGQLGEAPQGIVMDTENGQLFVSWEKDYIAGEEIRSLQLRIIDTDDRVLEPYLVSTKGNAYSSSSGQSSNLTMIPGTVVYSDSKIKIAYLGMNQNGEAIVKVEGN